MRKAGDDLGCLGLVGACVLFAFGYPAAAVGVLFLPAGLKLLRRKARSVELLLTLPAVARAFACDVKVGNGSTTFGSDRGAVTFLEGWLHFEGFRTAFSLSRDDVQRRRENRLELCQGGDVGFDPDEAGAKEFSSALDRWYRIERVAQGVSILPPVWLHPSDVAHAWGDLAYGLTKAIVLAAAIILFHLPAWLFFGGMGGLAAAADASRQIRRLARDERRALGNEDRPAMGR